MVVQSGRVFSSYSKGTIKDIEESLSSTQKDVESLKEAVKNTSETRDRKKRQIRAVHETRKSTVQQHPRNGEGRLQSHDLRHLTVRVLELDISSIRFHAVHRMGKLMQGRTSPIIVCFVSREDRNLFRGKRGKMKQSTVHSDAYITEDFACAIQEERKVLIKAMIKARDELGIIQSCWELFDN